MGLGAVVPCDASTVSRIESGLLNPTERFAVACDEAFPQMGGWFTRFYSNSPRWDGPYPSWFADWVDAERRAAVLRWWEPLLVPGLDVTWRKSSHSGGSGGNCVEVGTSAEVGRVLVRDTRDRQGRCWPSARRRGAVSPSG